MSETPAITVRDWAQTRAALEAARSQGRAAFLCSPAGASSWLGAGYWAALQQKARAEFPDVEFSLALDCDNKPGDVMAALRAGVGLCIFRGPAEILGKLQDMASQVGHRVQAG